jgi:hypothetical protein
MQKAGRVGGGRWDRPQGIICETKPVRRAFVRDKSSTRPHYDTPQAEFQSRPLNRQSAERAADAQGLNFFFHGRFIGVLKRFDDFIGQ